MLGMRAILLMAAIVAAGCGDDAGRLVGDDAVDFQEAAVTRLSECGIANPELEQFVPRFCAGADCNAESTIDIDVCLDDLAAMPCQFLGVPEDCKTCGYIGVPDSCRAMWIAAPHG